MLDGNLSAAGPMSTPIAAVTELYPPSVGGQESRFSRFAEALAARGRSVTVYTADHTGGTLPKEEVVRGVTVRRYLSIDRYVSNGHRSIRGLVRYRRATRELIQDLAREKTPIWVNQMPVVHLPGIGGLPGVVIDWCEYPTYSRVNFVCRWALRSSRRGTAVSQAIVNHLRVVSPTTDYQVVRTPIPPADGPEVPREPGTILYVGRLVAHKNLDALATAVKALANNGGPHPRLLIAGDGPERAVLQRRFGGNGAVTFLGSIDEAEKRRLLRTAWLVAIPGLREGLPNVAAEATVYGTPLLASGAVANSCGDFVRQHNLGVVAPGIDARAFTSALHGIDAVAWDRWSADARTASRLFDPAQNVDRLEAALDRAAG